MFRREFQQLQIFPEEGGAKGQKSSSNLTALLSNYEKRIKLFILFIISLLIVYSIGIERGKDSIEVKREKELIFVKDEEIKTPVPKKDEIRETRPKKDEIRETRLKKDETEKIRGYVIQVATYRKHSRAEKEAINLREKGYRAFTRRSGDFIVVYVGNFRSRDEAKKSLKRLRSRYSDCFIRKL